MLILILVIALFLILAYWAVPRSTLLHEATRLPLFWLNALASGLPKAAATHIAYGSHPKQYYLFCPAEPPPSGTTKWIIYFHGGSWRWGKPDLFLAHARQWTDLGFNVVLPSYRPCPKYNYTDIKADLIALLKHLSRSQPDWSAAATLTGGMSAGGHLAALMAIDASILNTAAPHSAPIKGFFALGAPLDFNQMPPSFALRDLAGNPEGRLFQEANPAHFLPLQNGQTALVIHGEQDGMVPVAAADSFVEQAMARTSGAVGFHKIARGTHLSIAAWPYQQGPVKTALQSWLKTSHSPNRLM